MIILFEGVDNTGKTTIANALSKIMGIPVYKNNMQKTLYIENNEKYFELLLKFGGNVELQLLQALNPNIIFDRSFVSEFAYARAFGRKTDEMFIRQLDKEFNKLGAIIVYCHKENIEDIFDDEVIPVSKVMEIQEAYEIYLNNITSIPFAFLNTTNSQLDEQINAILGFIQSQEILNHFLIKQSNK